jgi:hypothetical protein
VYPRRCGHQIKHSRSYFAGEIIGNLLELEARQWRRPRRVDLRRNNDRVEEFKKKYSGFDWTGML